MRYVALGDSITALRSGVNVYTTSLNKIKESIGLSEVINSGVGGLNTGDLLTILNEKCLSYNPNIASIMLGTNDHAVYSGKSSSAVSIENYRNNLNSIIDSIQSNITDMPYNNSKPKIILMTPPFVTTQTNASGTKTSQDLLIGYCNVVKDTAYKNNLELIDINKLTGVLCNWSESNLKNYYTHNNDGVHLNTYAQNIIFEELKKVMRKIIKNEIYFSY